MLLLLEKLQKTQNPCCGAVSIVVMGHFLDNCFAKLDTAETPLGRSRIFLAWSLDGM